MACSNEMKTAIINESTKFSGLGRYAQYLAKATDSELFSLRLDYSINPSNYPGNVMVFTPIVKVGNGWYFNHRFPAISLRMPKKWVKDKISKETVLHYSSQLIPWINLENRYIFTVHDLFGLNREFGNNKIEKILKQNLKNIISADRIVTDSNHVQKQLDALGASGKTTTIYPPVSSSFKKLENKSSIRNYLGLPDNKILVLSVSSQDPRKNLKAVVETMNVLGNDFALVRVGKPVDRCYSFTNVDDEKLNMIFNACDALLFPSLDEGFGYPLAEAMTVGLPSVASDIEIFRETAGDAAVLVDPSPVKLAKAIQEAIANSEHLAKKGIKKSERYSLERFKSDVCALYSELELDGF